MSPQGLLGAMVGDYEIISRIGAGGMGAVYEGRHPVIGKRVCIKVLHAHLTDDAEVMSRFIAEARAVNEIRHRGIVDIFTFGQLEDRSPYFIMELLEGASFEDEITTHGAFPVAVALPYFVEMLEAVGAAHASNIVHRDLKPSNIFLVKPPRGHAFVKVLDFGIAKLLTGHGITRTKGEMLGTPHYMAPEQVSNKGIGPSTDLYALGCVFYELLTGRKPFDGSNQLAVLRMQMSDRAPSLSSLVPNVPPELERLIARLMEKSPTERPASCDEVIEALTPLLDATAEERKSRGRPSLSLSGPVVGFADLANERTQVDDDARTEQLKRPAMPPPRPTTTSSPKLASVSAPKLPTVSIRASVAKLPAVQGESTQPMKRPPEFADTDGPTDAHASEAPTGETNRSGLGERAMTLTEQTIPNGRRNRRVLWAGLGLAALVATGGYWLGTRPTPVTLPPAPAVDADAGTVEALAPPPDPAPTKPGDAGQPSHKPAEPKQAPASPKAALERRLQAVRTQLAKREARIGQADPVLRMLLKKCESTVASASSPQAMSDASDALTDLEAQMQ